MQGLCKLITDSLTGENERMYPSKMYLEMGLQAYCRLHYMDFHFQTSSTIADIDINMHYHKIGPYILINEIHAGFVSPFSPNFMILQS